MSKGVLRALCLPRHRLRPRRLPPRLPAVDKPSLPCPALGRPTAAIRSHDRPPELRSLNPRRLAGLRSTERSWFGLTTFASSDRQAWLGSSALALANEGRDQCRPP